MKGIKIGIVFFVLITCDMLSTYYIMPDLKPNQYVYEPNILVKEYGFGWTAFLLYMYGTGMLFVIVYLYYQNWFKRQKILNVRYWVTEFQFSSKKREHCDYKQIDKKLFFHLILYFASFFCIRFFGFQKLYAAFDNLVLGLFMRRFEIKYGLNETFLLTKQQDSFNDFILFWVIGESVRERIYVPLIEVFLGLCLIYFFVQKGEKEFFDDKLSGKHYLALSTTTFFSK